MPGRIAVFRALHLGDLLCAEPALRALRAALPEARITLVGLPWASELVDRFSLDGFLSFPGYPGLPEQPWCPERFQAFLQEIRGQGLDLVLQMQGDGSIANALVERFGARLTAGFFPLGGPCPDGTRFLPYPERGLEVHRLLRLMEFLGAAGQGDRLAFPLFPHDFEGLDREIPERPAPGTYVCLHPGARSARRWPPEAFARVGDEIARRGFTVVLTGTAVEKPLTARVAALMQAPALDLAGRTRLGTLAALLGRSRLLVANDTGVAHLAEAVDIPSVVLFDPPQIERWAPADLCRHAVVSPVATAHPQEVLAAAAPWLGEPSTVAPGALRAAGPI